jgi:chitinase
MNMITNRLKHSAQRLLVVSLCILLCVSAVNVWAGSVSADTKVVGYIASFTDMKAAIDKTDLSKLTHINLSFTNPDAQGKLVNNGVMTCMPGIRGDNVSEADVRYVIDKAQSAGVKVLAAVAGGVIPSCSGNWQTLLQPANRQMIVDNLISFMEDFGLDGIDIDIEGALLTSIDNAGNYTPFIQALSAQLVARNKLLTSATASYVGGMIPVSSIPYFDFVNIMAYDAIGPSWGPAGVEHSPYSMADEHVNLWKNRGLTREQLVLGVPFYGYGFGTYKSDYTYASILSEFGVDSANKDVIGTACAGCNYITYNGAATIRSKTKLGLEEGSGIMIWELSQDTVGANSLLKVIDDEINQRSNSSASNQSSVGASSVVAVASSSSAQLSSVAATSSAKAVNNQSSGGGVSGFWVLLLLSIMATHRGVLRWARNFYI